MYCDGGDGIRLMIISHKSKSSLKGRRYRMYPLRCRGPKGESGNRFLDWIGGYFETHWSVNPHWTAKFDNLPEHPITNGVESFEVNDEWYYHMRFRPEMKGVTPILSALPPASTLTRPDGPHSVEINMFARLSQAVIFSTSLGPQNGLTADVDLGLQVAITTGIGEMTISVKSF